jgi:hypothetical protein
MSRSGVSWSTASIYTRRRRFPVNRARALHLALVVIGPGLAVPPAVPADHIQYRIVEEFELDEENPPEFAYGEFADTERQVLTAALTAGDGSHSVSPAAPGGYREFT